MNLDFGILWIEDSYSQQEDESLRRRISEAGFIARIESIPNGLDLEKHARAHRLFHRYDMILLDYHLTNENGDELALTIRELFPSTTILFYSGSAPENSLRQMIAEKQVEGVYCSARERFIERTGTLIDQTARALDRLSGMRGLAMKVVAECDELMKGALLSMSDRDPNFAAKVNELDNDVLSFLTECTDKYREAIDCDLRRRFETRVVDSAKLFKHFRRLTDYVAKCPDTVGLNTDQVETLRALRRSSAQYVEHVLKKRNMLGHVNEIESDAGWLLQGSDEISVADFPEIRRVFSNYVGAFRDICNLVGG
ncbi:response regulator [Methylolobus aquaticus]